MAGWLEATDRLGRRPIRRGQRDRIEVLARFRHDRVLIQRGQPLRCW
jgi:hypothetical protein